MRPFEIISRAVRRFVARNRRRAGLAEEAAALARDPAYVREAREVARLMGRAARFPVTFTGVTGRQRFTLA